MLPLPLLLTPNRPAERWGPPCHQQAALLPCVIACAGPAPRSVACLQPQHTRRVHPQAAKADSAGCDSRSKCSIMPFSSSLVLTATRPSASLLADTAAERTACATSPLSAASSARMVPSRAFTLLPVLLRCSYGGVHDTQHGHQAWQAGIGCAA
jgi:hypothetical protein